MKNLIIISVFLLLGLKGFGQNCVTFKSDTFNCTDSGNLKQSLWKTFEIHYESKSLQPYMDNEGKMHSFPGIRCVPREITDSSLIITAEGFYKDNKKVGVWKYFYHGGCFVSEIRTEYYNEDGSFDLEENDYEISYNKDSSIVACMTNFSKDTINIKCLNKLCKTSFGNNTLNQFKQNSDAIEIEIIKIVGGIYYREIKRIKELK